MKKELSNVEYCTQTIELFKTLEQGFFEAAERLSRIYEHRLYEPKWEAWEDYLDDAKITPSSASKLIKIHQVLVQGYGIQKKQLVSIGKENAYELSLIVKSKDDALDWLEKGKTLLPGHMRVALREARTGVPQTGCEHKNGIKLFFCPKCHLRERI